MYVCYCAPAERKMLYFHLHFGCCRLLIVFILFSALFSAWFSYLKWTFFCVPFSCDAYTKNRRQTKMEKSSKRNIKILIVCQYCIEEKRRKKKNDAKKWNICVEFRCSIYPASSFIQLQTRWFHILSYLNCKHFWTWIHESYWTFTNERLINAQSSCW